MLDLQRFSETAEITALPTAGDLNEYTFLVAGSVGEFWTRLGFRHVRNFATRLEDEMLALGKSYGMGLQLVNILRDAGADLRAGRCYFPEEELISAGLSPAQVLSEPEPFQPIYESWITKAEGGLESGMQYSLAIGNRRVRAATVLPALIGTRTLALLREAGASALHRRIKVSRREVRRIIASTAIAFASRTKLDAIFRRSL
jgi:farnesyl-diphosphate farnesyltransferase